MELSMDNEVEKSGEQNAEQDGAPARHGGDTIAGSKASQLPIGLKKQ